MPAIKNPAPPSDPFDIPGHVTRGKKLYDFATDDCLRGVHRRNSNGRCVFCSDGIEGECCKCGHSMDYPTCLARDRITIKPLSELHEEARSHVR